MEHVSQIDGDMNTTKSTRIPPPRFTTHDAVIDFGPLRRNSIVDLSLASPGGITREVLIGLRGELPLAPKPDSFLGPVSVSVGCRTNDSTVVDITSSLALAIAQLLEGQENAWKQYEQSSREYLSRLQSIAVEMGCDFAAEQDIANELLTKKQWRIHFPTLGGGSGTNFGHGGYLNAFYHIYGRVQLPLIALTSIVPAISEWEQPFLELSVGEASFGSVSAKIVVLHEGDDDETVSEILRKVDQIRRKVSTSPDSGFLWTALSQARDKLQLVIEPSTKGLELEVAALKLRLETIETTARKIVELLEKG